MTDIKLINKDCLPVLKGMPSNSVDLIVIDPPYEIKNTKTGSKSELNRSFQKVNNELVSQQLTEGFDIKILDELVRINRKVNMYIFCNKAQLLMYMNYFVAERGCNFDLIKWVKTNAVPTFNNKYLTDTEYCIYVRNGGYCKPSSYDDAKTLYHQPINIKDKRKYGHPTIKPLPLLEKLIRNSSQEGDTVLDCFMGSGSTGVACKKLQRHFIGIEINKEYFELSNQRINNAA
ncbi:site-specific DNA-methyltransferase [Vibrio splendidus]